MERHEWVENGSGMYVLSGYTTADHPELLREILRLAARVRELEGEREALAFVVAALPHSHDSTTGKCLVCGKKWHALFSEHSDGCPMPEAQSIAAREIESRIATREGK